MSLCALLDRAERAPLPRVVWCETLITAHADLVELASDADLLNSGYSDEHEQRLTQRRGVIEAHRRHAARLREGLSFKLRLVH